jgi:hypothetical protein
VDNKLKIPCAMASMDSISLTVLPPDERAGPSVIRVAATDLESKASVFLTEATARELFNWLGIELHKGGLYDGRTTS